MKRYKKHLKVTFLGTGTSQGVPMIASKDPVCLSKNLKDKRLRSSVLISWNDVSYVVDCGPDFRQQMLRENIECIQGVLFTHEHADHTAGLDDLRPFCYQIAEMPIYLNQKTLDSLEQRFQYIFSIENRYPGAPSVSPFVVNNSSFTLHELTVQPIQILHGKLSILGYRFEQLAYLTDVKYIAEAEKEKLQNLDVLIVNALRIEAHPTHLNLKEALELVAELQPKRTYFTHISHKLGFHDEVSRKLPKNVFLAFDGLKIET
ncbi:MBL fold metallo-hydrolase [Polaribacter batillariae]|uniref:MBL fold metallo-hydrolase n=1 Tax=Polaribacter batillariae TaxID=2808900 RepID=A0ABX7SWL1_9FLAO|nr:MBL fold metallo-hydrolase [Polaribacter batillariae]QTD38059.1 MBL fold metallo-hydrolase [Polaribacter batillariae]